MSAEHDSCYLCASDEGILLDIFGDAGQTLRENIEACLSVKIERSDAPSGKICHKCAYELDSCGRFLGKYKRSKDSRKQRASAEPGGRCCLCGEEGKKVRLLEINAGNSLEHSLRKIGQAFDKDFFEDRIIERLCVCLGCRYNVDVLSDLKNIYRGRPIKMKSADKNGLTLSNLRKTRTRVVSRKTTYIPQPKLNTDPDCDSNASVSSGDATLSRKRGRPTRHKEVAATSRTTKTSSHFRTCEECETMVEHGVDMYRYHRTGLTVCKDCWLTMDPERISNRKAKKLARAGSDTSTKLCAVFLKDVLSNPTKYSNIYRIERDEHGNATFLITDESSENEDREKKSDSVAGVEGSSDGKRKRPIKRSPVDSAKTEDVGGPKRARPAMRRSQEPEESPRIVAVTKTRNGTQSDSGRTRMTRSKRGSSESTTNSESWVNGGRGTRVKKSNRDEESANKAQPIETSIATRSGRTIKSVSPVARLGRPRKGTRAKKRPDSSTSRATPPPASSTAGSPDRSSDESIPSSEPPGETFAGGDEAAVALEDSRKTSRSDSEIEKPYSCSVCRVVCVNKLDGKSHELTHEKQPEVKLRRVVVPSLETIDEISSVPEAAEQSLAASDPAESADRTEDHPATVTAAVDEETTVRSITPPTVEDKHNSAERSDDRQREDGEDQQSQQPSNAILVETSAESAVAAEEKKEEEETREVEEKEDVADETMRVSEVEENEDKTKTDGGEDSAVTKSPETRGDSATVEDEAEKPDSKCDESNENRVESKESPEVTQRGEPRDPEELGSDKQRTEPETEPIIKDSAEDDLQEEKNGAAAGTPTRSSPVKDVSATEPEAMLVDDDGSNGDTDSVGNEKKKVVEDEERELASLEVAEDAEPELAPLKVVDEEDEEAELASLKVVDEEEKELESAASTVQEKLVEAEEKEPELVSSELTEKMVEAEEEAESSSSKMEKKEMEVKEDKEPESISSTVQEKVPTAEEKEPELASSEAADKLAMEEEEEENEGKRNAEQGKEEEKQEEGEGKEEGQEENEVEEEEKKVEEEANEEKKVENEEKEVNKEKEEDEKEEEEKDGKEVEERQRIVDPNEEKQPSTEVAFREVFDLASDEVKKRLENGDRNSERLATPAETLENISLEIQKSADMSEVDEESTAIGGS